MDPNANVDKNHLITFQPPRIYRPLHYRLVAIPLALACLPLFPLSLLYRNYKLRQKRENTVKTSVSLTALMVSTSRTLAHWLGLLNEPYATYFTPLSIQLYAFCFEYLPFVAFGYLPETGLRFFFPTLVGRSLLFDDVVKNSTDCEQYVILGAGFDCRGQRLGKGKKIVFEVDAPFTQARKRGIVQDNIDKLPNKNIVYVPCDFSKQSFLEELVKHGFDPTRKTVFTLEGVTRYLEWSNLAETLSLVTKCAKGSIIAMNLSIDKWSTEELRRRYEKDQEHFARVAQIGEPVKFGMDLEKDTPEKKFLPLGFSSVDVWIGPDELDKRCGFVGQPEKFRVNDIHFVALRV